MITAVVTIAHGRHEHLRRQVDGLARCQGGAPLRVIASMADPALAHSPMADGATVVEVAVPADGELPLARARNAGAAAALAVGAGLLVFLDVDCIPAPELLHHYRRASLHPAHADALLCGPVSYLPPAAADGYPMDRLAELADPHPARPNPAPGVVADATDRRLFWSLSFACTAFTWRRIGGFDEDYTGYGGEDTDFAERAHRAGVGMRWVGGATAYHQHHPVRSPPVEHLDAILRNARRFHRRWGWWPMTGWLDAFARDGLIAYGDGDWRRLPVDDRALGPA